MTNVVGGSTAPVVPPMLADVAVYHWARVPAAPGPAVPVCFHAGDASPPALFGAARAPPAPYVPFRSVATGTGSTQSILVRQRSATNEILQINT